MANRVYVTGIAIERAINPYNEGERLVMLVEGHTKAADSVHVKVTTDDPRLINWFRQYNSRPLFITGELCADSDGGLYIHAEVIDYSRVSRPKSAFKNFNPVLKPLPTEKFADR
jgi:hypothetical protein